MLKVNIPGLRNSDENHWQSHWERSQPEEFMRVQQENWEEPDCETWITKIEQDLASQRHAELILIGHSIGCMAIVKWYERYGHPIKGALLVAPSDAERDNYPTYIRGFTPIPTAQLGFPSIVVGSTNDHVTTLDRTRTFAQQWGSQLVVLENAGHLEPKSGFGAWPQGLEFLRQLERMPR
ncbi:MAG: alpha/beta hydrolase [Bacteroidota bacterium]